MRDLFLVALVAACVIQTLRSPVFGVLAFTAISLVYPQSFTWGFGRTLPIAQVQAIATLASCVIHPSALRWKFPKEIVLLLMFWAWTGVTTMFAMFPNKAADRLGYVSKILVMIVATVLVLRTREHLNWIVRIVALSLGFHGLRAGIFTLSTGATQMVFGPEDSFLTANNAIGLALAMNVPLLFFQARQEKSVWMKRLMWAMAAFSYPAVVATFSRGAWLGLAASTVMVVLALPFRWKIVAVTAGVIIALISIPLMPDRVTNRYEDLKNAETESSAQSRVWNWQMAWNVSVARPIFGAGYEYYSYKIYAMYFPEFLVRWPGKVWSCHSAWFTTLSEHGFPGFFMWTGMILAGLLSSRRLAGLYRGSAENSWIADYGDMLTASIISFMVSATFLDAAYFDLIYNIISIVVVMGAAVRLGDAASATAIVQPAGGRPGGTIPSPRIPIVE